ncbi:hypothetical protein NU10_14055 [Flavobacterium dauae]|uniref:hypothetical protein n=1 Tax=Flavobacterium dauae TaxID=1563479 RepID=UPI00101DCECE|nr:hypothetical protein [Flavobacterium dauae]WLD23808.1 hypothetical protein NU10_14055 [Flavobacterium dauae]
METVCNKHRTKELLEHFSIPVPHGARYRSFEKVKTVLEDYGFSMGIKPLNGHQGKGASVNITTEQQLHSAYVNATKFGSKVITECFY